MANLSAEQSRIRSRHWPAESDPLLDKSKIGAPAVLRAYSYAFAGWGAFALLMASQDFVAARSYNPHATFLQSLVVPIVRGTTTALLTPALYFVVLKWPFSKVSFWMSTLRYAGLAVGFNLAFCMLRWVLFPGWDYLHKRWLPRSFDSLLGFAIGGFADQVILFLMMVIAAHVWVVERNSRLQSLTQSNLQREVAELELQLLQMQLHPHFIFNTLHGINTLMERDVETAKTMLLHLADLLRAAISSQSQDLVQLKKELEFIASYVALEQMRLGSRLRVTFDVQDAANDALVPYMILQPIVENAILHGAAASRVGGWVNIVCRIESKSLLLELLNNATAEPSKPDGLGLRNTRARLQNLFEQEATFDFIVRDGVASTRIVLPLITAREAITR